MSSCYVCDPAPDFNEEALIKGDIKKIKLSDYKGKYLVVFFYPLDWTFVCPTEIIEFSIQAKKFRYFYKFREIGCEVVGVSVDSCHSHLAYCKTPRNKGGLGELDFPLIGDITKKMSTDYNCIKKGDGIALRATYIIDGNGILRHMQHNDLPVGRNVDEIRRLVEAYQYTDVHGEVCPATWKKKGDPSMIGGINQEKNVKYFEEVHAKQQ